MTKMPDTILVKVSNDPNSEVKELQQMNQLVFLDAIFGCHDLALVKSEDTALQTLQLKAEQEVADGILNGEIFTANNHTVDF